MQYENSRGVFLFGIIGDNGTGKTVTAREIAIEWKSNRPGWDVVAFDPTDGFKGVANKFLDVDNWCQQALSLRNSLLILDEFRILHPNDKVDANLRKLFAIRRFHNIDIIYIVHSPALVIEFLTYFTSKYFIYYTQITSGKFKRKIPNYASCQGGSTLINNYVSEFGKGEYNNGNHTFPYVVIDCEKDKIDAVNMPIQNINQLT